MGMGLKFRFDFELWVCRWIRKRKEMVKHKEIKKQEKKVFKRLVVEIFLCS